MPARQRVVADVTAWFAAHARPLPWREPDCTPWGVMVSEYMLQQTPVARVLPVWAAWLERCLSRPAWRRVRDLVRADQAARGHRVGDD